MITKMMAVRKASLISLWKNSMIQFVFWGLMILVISSSVFVIASLHSKPKLIITPQSNQLGNIYKGESKTGFVTITNAGRKAVLIKSVEGCCDLEVKKINETGLKAGDSLKLNYKLTSKKMKPGPFIKMLTLETDSPGNLLVDFCLEGNLEVRN